MTPLFHLIVLALIQGITEFLPISSSAHLIILPRLMAWRDQGPLIDVMAHVGTLAAVLVYFHRDILAIAAGKWDILRGRVATPDAHLVLMLAVSTPPALIVGAALFLTDAVDALRDPVLIAWMNLIFAVPLWLADRYARTDRTLAQFSYRGAVLTGLAQCLALIPGVSRSGVTMTAARALGLGRSEAAHFSMLMAIPILAAFGAAAGLELAREGADGDLGTGLVVAGLSFLSALGVIALMMRLIDRIGFLPFALYRLALAVLLFAMFGFTVGG